MFEERNGGMINDAMSKWLRTAVKCPMGFSLPDWHLGQEKNWGMAGISVFGDRLQQRRYRSESRFGSFRTGTPALRGLGGMQLWVASACGLDGWDGITDGVRTPGVSTRAPASF